MSAAPTRKGFLAGLVAQAAALVGVGAVARASEHAASRPRKPGERRYGMVIDLDKCTGCGACVVACSAENNQMLGSAEEAAQGRLIRWLDILPVASGGFPTPKASLMPMPCQQCENPPCAKVCPVYATFLNEDGIVGQVYSRCIGCRYCVNACPYTCKFFNWRAPVFPGSAAGALNPDVSVRPKGVVEKCLFCHHRLQRAKEAAAAEGRPLHEAEYQPACAEACPAKAIVFGDLADPESEAALLSRDARATRLLEGLGTEPKVTYLREGA